MLHPFIYGSEGDFSHGYGFTAPIRETDQELSVLSNVLCVGFPLPRGRQEEYIPMEADAVRAGVLHPLGGVGKQAFGQLSKSSQQGTEEGFYVYFPLELSEGSGNSP